MKEAVRVPTLYSTISIWMWLWSSNCERDMILLQWVKYSRQEGITRCIHGTHGNIRAQGEIHKSWYPRMVDRLPVQDPLAPLGIRSIEYHYITRNHREQMPEEHHPVVCAVWSLESIAQSIYNVSMLTYLGRVPHIYVRPALLQILACRTLNANPISESMLPCLLDSYEQISRKSQ